MKTSEKDTASEFQFKTVYQFVDAFIRPTYGRTNHRIKDANWSPRWWAHPEAVLRLHSLWQAYEAGRQQAPATHIESFLRVCSDYHMRVIMSPDGVFADAKRKETPTIPLPSEPIEGDTDV